MPAIGMFINLEQSDTEITTRVNAFKQGWA